MKRFGFHLRIRHALLAVVALMVLGAPLWAPRVLRRLAFFHVRRIEIVGAHYLAPSDILARLHVDTTVSVWDPTAPLVARLANHPEIQRVDIHSKLPGTLVVNVTERAPVALVPTRDGFRAYDAGGRPLPVDPLRVDIDAPVLLTPDTSVLRLLGQMRRDMPALYGRVSLMQRVGNDELEMRMRGVTVRAMTSVTLRRLADLEPVEADLAKRQARVSEIDLRYRDQVIARLQ